MARENSSGLGVNTRYGPVSIPDGARGELHSDSGLIYLTADWSADLINNDSINAAITIVKNILPLLCRCRLQGVLAEREVLYWTYRNGYSCCGPQDW